MTSVISRIPSMALMTKPTCITPHSRAKRSLVGPHHGPACPLGLISQDALERSPGTACQLPTAALLGLSCSSGSGGGGSCGDLFLLLSLGPEAFPYFTNPFVPFFIHVFSVWLHFPAWPSSPLFPFPLLSSLTLLP